MPRSSSREVWSLFFWLTAPCNVSNVHDCLNVTVPGTVAAIRDRNGISDYEIPPVIHEQFRQFCSLCQEAPRGDGERY